MRILVVGADTAATKTIQTMLTDAALPSETAARGDEAIDLATLYDYDLMVLDLGIKDMTGTDVLQKLRADRNPIPVLCLSGGGSLSDKVDALNSGADDVLSKPFHRDEIVARANALVRRSRGHASSTVEAGDLTVDLDAQHVLYHGERVRLTRREYQMVEALVLRQGTTLSKEMLLARLYGGMDAPEIKVIDVFVCKIRKKFSAIREGDGPIETVWGRGYCLPHAEDARAAA